MEYILILVILFLLVIAREIIADIQDHEEDVLGGKKTLAVVVGPRVSFLVASSISYASSLVFFILGAFVFTKNYYLSIPFVFFAFFVAWVTYQSKGREDENLDRYMKLTGLTAFLVPFFFFI